MSGINAESLESALESAFGDQPEAPETPEAPQQAENPTAAEPAEEDPADLLAGEAEPAKEPEAEPEFELEIEPGKPEVLPLARLKELAARGAKAGRGFEENARVREALAAHVQQAQMSQQFQQAVSADIAQLQSLDNLMEQQFGKVDWQKEFSEDPFNAMKLKEQRDQLREQRAAALQGLNAKQQQFQAHFQQNAQRVLAAEQEALLAKVPAWRNAEKAKAEQGEIASVLTSQYGFAPQEVGTLIDHRMLLVARDAAAYRKLLANKDARVKQARQAPATAKPGAAVQPDGRAEFNKVRGKLRELGSKGNHKAQEKLAEAMFERAFKS